MTAKKYLSSLECLDIKINHKIKEQEDLREKLKTIKSIDYSKERVQTSPSGVPSFVKTIEHIDELSREINSEIDKFIDEKHKIINQIHKLQDARYIDILYKRYIDYKKLKDIAIETGYSYDYVVELHQKALQELEKEPLLFR